MLPLEPNTEAGKPNTRRQLLASMGAAGVLLAAGVGLPVQAQAAEPVLQTDTSAWFNVKDFGAGNKRSDDDTPFIQSAINAAAESGGTVYIPPGKYVIRSSLVMRPKVHLLGAGIHAAVLKAGSANLRMVISGADVTHYSIQGLTFEGMGAGSASPVPVVECGVYAAEAEYVRISNCMFDKINNGIQLIRSKHVSVTGCLFYFILGTDGAHEGYGVMVEGGSSHKIQTNHFKNVYKHGILLTAGSAYTIVANNVLESCKEAAILVASKLVACSHHLIQGNLISADGLGDTETSCTYGIRLKDRCSFTTVTANVIARSRSAGILLDAEEKAGEDRPYGNTVTGNTVNQTLRGIAILNGDANTVKHNDVRRVDTGVLVDAIGEDSWSYAKQNIVTGNTLIQCHGSGVRIGSPRCQGSVVFGNTGFDNAVGLQDSGTDTAMTGF
ncbi:right-handed parallel beta-helix repeat-containing protein [Paenibacillus xerothermodurans]|uniref:Pectate lyase superfamily protein domain-containing protein n=1 Tax=Paenibacillus xerothermodurans TaxID=1977292 RepID=A0A2W1NFP9_PAEXE|nr:NosD domain-containing protein [Paenibacillus xerothermodurans]PZE22510.1 hypothetical protein CBW46_001620 [Paenibacillus xerothermodurans]